MSVIDQRVLSRRILWRLAVPTILFMFCSSLDRTNISFAALTMNRELGLSASQYGFGAGILFVGFLAGQYPSILFFQRVGMSRWMATCALLWGSCALAMAFMKTAPQFYFWRVLLGLAEGGLAPGIVLYLSQFATERERARTFALPMLAVPMSIILGGPISGLLMSRWVPQGAAGWRWMMIAEAVPALALGVAALFYFPDTPRQARWLKDDERRWLESNAANRAVGSVRNDWTVLRHPLVWFSALLWFCLLSGSYGIQFWLPQMLKQLTTLSTIEIGFVNALPWIGLAIGIYFNSAHSDRTGERLLHVALPALLCAMALLAAWWIGPGVLGLGILFVAGLGLGAAQGAFWSVPTSLLTPSTLAVAAVAINLCGSSGGFLMPYLMGIAKEHTDGFSTPTMLVVGILVLAVMIVWGIGAMQSAGGKAMRGPESAERARM